MDINKLLYRRQFILGSRFINCFPHWKREKVDNDIFLTVHPDLPITKVASNKNSIIMLGYILDPLNVSHDNFRILESIIAEIKSADDIFVKIARMCGRFVMIAKINNDFRIFNDTSGMRQIFYYKDTSNRLWCASQPSLITEQFKLLPDKGIHDDLFKMSFFSTTSEYWYPGNSTIYKDIFHLTPNHYIDLDKLSIKRYWPTKRINAISIQECLKRNAFILTSLLEAASERFSLALGISAGYDSRIVLAASRKVSHKILYFTHIPKNGDTTAFDVAIPTALLKSLKLRHQLLITPDTMAPDFEQIFGKNVTTARTCKGLNVFALFEYFKSQKNEIVLASGNISEIAKRNVRRLARFPNKIINGYLLSLLAGMQSSRFARIKFREWFVCVKGLPRLGINLLDLFYWEQRMAN